MKNLLLLVGMLFCAITATAQYNQSISPNNGEDWSGSPRLLVQKGNAQDVELASTTVTGAIVGVIADVNIRQVYVNHGTKPIEAVYVFPGSTRAERVEENAGATAVQLSPADLASLQALAPRVAGERYAAGGMKTLNG